MLFYDIDPFGERPEPKPLSDEEYNKRIERFNEITADYKNRLRTALGARKARDYANSELHQSFSSRDAYLDLNYENWEALLLAVSEGYCFASILATIRFTPKKYRAQWTVEELDEKISACKLNEEVRYQILRKAGLPCEEPESMIRRRREHEEFERERKERMEQWRKERDARETALEKKWGSRLDEIENQLIECGKHINECYELARAEGIEISTTATTAQR